MGRDQRVPRRETQDRRRALRRRQVDRGQRAGERVHDFGVELRAGAAPQLAQRLGRGSRRAIGARAGHGVEGVGDVDDAREQGNLVAAQAVRVAAAVGPLVMQLDDRDVRREERHVRRMRAPSPGAA